MSLSVEDLVAGLVESAVGSAVGLDVPLLEAGLDSLSSTDLVKSLASEFELEFPTTLLFDCPSIVAVSDAVLS